MSAFFMHVVEVYLLFNIYMTLTNIVPQNQVKKKLERQKPRNFTILSKIDVTTKTFMPNLKKLYNCAKFHYHRNSSLEINVGV